MKSVKLFAVSMLMLVSSALPAQTWINVGGANQSWTISAPATFRFGYPDSTGKNWVVASFPAGDLPNGPSGSQIPSGVASLTNPGNLPLEVDVQQSAVTVEEEDVWGGTGCETIITFTIPATGAIPPPSQSACPGSPPVTKPPVTTPPVATPPVTSPPVTTTPPGTLPVPPVSSSTAAGTVALDATGANLVITFPVGSTVPPGGGIVGNVGQYTVFVFNNLPVLANQ